MTRLPSLVAIHGLKRAGKGAVAAHLAATHGYARVKFATAFKEMLAVALHACGLDAAAIERCIEGDLKETPIPALGGKSARFAMQILGADFRVAVCPRMWGRMTFRSIAEVRARGGSLVLDDLRFPHEVDQLREAGAELWLLERTVRSGVPAGSDLPWPEGPGSVLAINGSVLDGMLRVMLRHSGLSPSDAERAIWGDRGDEPIGLLDGATASACRRALERVWLAAMERPSEPGTGVTETHVSERGLRPELFDVRISNEGSLQDLHDAVDAALLGRRLAAA
jgi:hypothetical protein